VSDFSWPERPICHGDVTQGGIFKFNPPVWRAPEDSRDNGPYYYDFRTCSYCGSIHPEDLLRVLDAGATMHGADWKYGWPHKFYLENVPNRYAGQIRRMGGVFIGRRIDIEAEKRRHPDAVNWREVENGWDADIMGPAPKSTPAKWYNEHLLDLEEAAFVKVRQVILMHTHIEFRMIDGKLCYWASPTVHA
jgi:hypothetical protein